MRRDDVAQTDRLDPSQHGVGATGHFNAGFQHAIFQFGAVMQTMIVAVNSEHIDFRKGIDV